MKGFININKNPYKVNVIANDIVTKNFSDNSSELINTYYNSKDNIKVEKQLINKLNVSQNQSYPSEIFEKSLNSGIGTMSKFINKKSFSLIDDHPFQNSFTNIKTFSNFSSKINKAISEEYKEKNMNKEEPKIILSETNNNQKLKSFKNDVDNNNLAYSKTGIEEPISEDFMILECNFDEESNYKDEKMKLKSALITNNENISNLDDYFENLYIDFILRSTNLKNEITNIKSEIKSDYYQNSLYDHNFKSLIFNKKIDEFITFIQSLHKDLIFKSTNINSSYNETPNFKIFKDMINDQSVEVLNLLINKNLNFTEYKHIILEFVKLHKLLEIKSLPLLNFAEKRIFLVNNCLTSFEIEIYLSYFYSLEYKLNDLKFGAKLGNIIASNIYKLDFNNLTNCVFYLSKFSNTGIVNWINIIEFIDYKNKRIYNAVTLFKMCSAVSNFFINYFNTRSLLIKANNNSNINDVEFSIQEKDIILRSFNFFNNIINIIENKSAIKYNSEFIAGIAQNLRSIFSNYFFKKEFYEMVRLNKDKCTNILKVIDREINLKKVNSNFEIGINNRIIFEIITNEVLFFKSINYTPSSNEQNEIKISNFYLMKSIENNYLINRLSSFISSCKDTLCFIDYKHKTSHIFEFYFRNNFNDLFNIIHHFIEVKTVINFKQIKDNNFLNKVFCNINFKQKLKLLEYFKYSYDISELLKLINFKEVIESYESSCYFISYCNEIFQDVSDPTKIPVMQDFLVENLSESCLLISNQLLININDDNKNNTKNISNTKNIVKISLIMSYYLLFNDYYRYLLEFISTRKNIEDIDYDTKTLINFILTFMSKIEVLKRYTNYSLIVDKNDAQFIDLLEKIFVSLKYAEPLDQFFQEKSKLIISCVEKEESNFIKEYKEYSDLSVDNLYKQFGCIYNIKIESEISSKVDEKIKIDFEERKRSMNMI